MLGFSQAALAFGRITNPIPTYNYPFWKSLLRFFNLIVLRCAASHQGSWKVGILPGGFSIRPDYQSDTNVHLPFLEIFAEIFQLDRSQVAQENCFGYVDIPKVVLLRHFKDKYLQDYADDLRDKDLSAA
jgi:hypothetical protein